MTIKFFRDGATLTLPAPHPERRFERARDAAGEWRER